MKAKLGFFLFPISMIYFSCNMFPDMKPESQTHLDEKVFKSKDITVRWYKISTITTIHDFIDLERWKYSDNIMNSNTDGIYDIKIEGDTILIKTLPGLIIYDLVSIKNGCRIKIDSSVTLYDYMKKYQPENAKYYIEEKHKNK